VLRESLDSARDSPCASSAARSISSPTARRLLEYLQFDDAWFAIEAARAEAFATGIPVPPYRLDECDRNIIESALFAPQTAFGGVEKYLDLPAKTAALLYALAKTQACPEGNKRVALILVMEFLAINGSTLDVDPDALADIILDVAESDAASRDEVVDELTENMRPLVVPLTAEDE